MSQTDVNLTVSATSQEPTGLRLMLTLALAGVLSGMALAGVYELTLPIIEANNARELRQAVLEVVPGAETMQPVTLEAGGLRVADEADEQVVFAAYDDAGELAGYAIASEGPGFQDTIRLLYGYDPTSERVTGMQILESRETPGLGDKIYKDPDFLASFTDLSPSPEVKLARDGREEANEVDAITGATISSAAVVKIINRASDTWLEHLPGADQAPPLAERPEQAAPAKQAGEVK